MNHKRQHVKVICLAILPVTILSATSLLAWQYLHKTDECLPEDDIRAVVFRYQMQRWKKGIYFLSVGSPSSQGLGQDPNDELMRQLQDIAPLPRKASQSKSDWYGCPQDKQTKAKGEWIYVSGIERVSPSEVEVEGGKRICDMGYETYSYRLRYRWFHWTITEAILQGQA